MLEESDAELLLVTRGGHGMSLFRRGARRVDVPAMTRDVYDVTGAGDTVLSFAGLGHLCAMSFEDAAQIAMLAAGIVIEKIGAAIAEPVELEAAVGILRTQRGKELDAGEAAAGEEVDTVV